MAKKFSTDCHWGRMGEIRLILCNAHLGPDIHMVQEYEIGGARFYFAIGDTVFHTIDDAKQYVANL